MTMGIFYKVTDKELLQLRNKIVVDAAIPALQKQGFSKSPFTTPWNGRNNLGDFSYELCRLSSGSLLQIVEVYVSRGDRWIQLKLNVFRLHPKVEAIEELRGLDGLQFKLPPNSLTELRLRVDDIKGMPLLRLGYMNGHRLKRYYTKSGLRQSIIMLRGTIERDIRNIDRFVSRWNELHHPLVTNWTGHQVTSEAINK